MQRIFLFIVMMSAVLSCGISEIGEADGKSGSGRGEKVDVNDPHDGATSVRKICYITAMDYEQDYDWRADEARGTVKCSLVVYEDGLPVMKVPVGDAFEISSDPDRHRIIDGYLFTDYSTAAETVVRRDGVELFRYPGCEYICGMQLIEGDLYTLGQPKDGLGFTMRKNGEVVLSNDRASLVGELFNDSDNLCFAFCEQDRYYASINGSVSQVAVREDVKQVWDILVCRDKVIYVATLADAYAPVLVIGGSMTKLSFPIGATLLSCKIFKTVSSVGVEGLYRLRSGAYVSTVWLDQTELCEYVDKGSISALTTDGEDVFFVMNHFGRKTGGFIYRYGELLDMPQGYTVISDNCVGVVDETLYVGMSSQDGCKPIVWKDGIVDSFDINGYISAICQMDVARPTSPTKGCVTGLD